MAKSKKYNRQKERLIPFKDMRDYIAKNITSATRKMKRWMDSELYKGSPTMQVARKNLKQMYKKYGFDEGKYHTGKIFRDQIKSYEDLRTLYRTIVSIQGANAKEAKAHFDENVLMFENAKKMWKEMGMEVSDIDYAEAFDVLSYLSQEYHEMFAILTYNEVQIALANNKTPISVFQKYANKLKDKVLTPKQEEYVKITNNKIRNTKGIKSRDLNKIFPKF